MEEVTLNWEGPYATVHTWPESQQELDRLAGEGVYLWCREYPTHDLVVHVGETKNIARRFSQWLTQFLAWQCRVRRGDGTIFADYTLLQFFQNLANLDEAMPLAKSELQLTRFYYSFTTKRKDAEGHLIELLTRRAADTQSTGRPIVFGQKREPFDASTVLRHDFSHLIERECEHGTLAYILTATNVTARNVTDAIIGPGSPHNESASPSVVWE
jgi:hypothetical protein